MSRLLSIHRVHFTEYSKHLQLMLTCQKRLILELQKGEQRSKTSLCEMVFEKMLMSLMYQKISHIISMYVYTDHSLYPFSIKLVSGRL